MRSWKRLSAIAIVAIFLCSICAALIEAARRGPALVRVGLKSDASLELLASPEDAPLANAIIARDAAEVSRLLKLGANPNAVIRRPFSNPESGLEKAVHLAVRQGNSGVLAALLAAGADPNSRDGERSTCLTVLADLPDLRSADEIAGSVDALCRAGADVDAPNGEGYRPLHLATISGNSTYAGLLLARGADANALDGSACTPLVVACACFSNTKCESIIEALVRHGADIAAHDRDGRTALDILKKDGHAEAAKRLETLWEQVHGATKTQHTDAHR